MAGPIGSSNVDGDKSPRQPLSSRIRRKAKDAMPMTAMIDVTFLLLIYFLLSTTFRQAEGQLAGTLPGPPGPDPPPVVLSLQVHAIGDDCQSAVYSLEGDIEPLRSPQELVDALLARRGGQTRGEAIVVVQAGRAVRWRYIVEACNQAARANFQTTIRIQDQS